jgi:hypothetical protein
MGNLSGLGRMGLEGSERDVGRVGRVPQNTKRGRGWPEGGPRVPYAGRLAYRNSDSSLSIADLGLAPTICLTT